MHLHTCCFTKVKHKRRFRKSNSSKKIKLKYRRRSKRSRSRRLQKGGLRRDTNSGEALGITNTWSFKTEEYQNSFKKYIFGTQEHMDLWTELLIACRDKEIPVYIITSGNLVGVIRTIQLLGLAEYVEEVISVRKDSPANPNPEINPARYFAEQSKPKVIQRIIVDKGFSCSQEAPVAAFFDDQDGNFTHLDTLCPSVKIVDVGRIIFDSSLKLQRANELIRDMGMSKNFFFTTVFKDSRHPVNKSGSVVYNTFLSDHNFTAPRILRRAIDGITGNKTVAYRADEDADHLIPFSKIRILFLDWDGTVSFWPGPPDFHGVDYNNIKQYITETPI